MAELFNVVFAGELVGRAEPAVVRANVGKLFNASDAVLDKLFSGQPVAIKKMVDRATAMQLRARMKQAGAETRLVQVDEQGQPLAAPATAAPAASAAPAAPRPAPAAPTPAAAPVRPAATAPAPASAPAPAPAGSMAARLQAQAAQADAAPAPAAASPSASAAPGDWGIKPVGTRLSDPAPPPPPAPDTSAMSLARPGGDLVAPQEIPRPAPVQVDISGLSMAAAGTEVLKEDERRLVTPVQVDLSGISMAEVGAPLDELREDKAPVNPDISHIKLAD